MFQCSNPWIFLQDFEELKRTKCSTKGTATSSHHCKKQYSI